MLVHGHEVIAHTLRQSNFMKRNKPNLNNGSSVTALSAAHIGCIFAAAKMHDQRIVPKSRPHFLVASHRAFPAASTGKSERVKHSCRLEHSFAIAVLGMRRHDFTVVVWASVCGTSSFTLDRSISSADMSRASDVTFSAISTGGVRPSVLFASLFEHDRAIASHRVLYASDEKFFGSHCVSWPTPPTVVVRGSVLGASLCQRDQSFGISFFSHDATIIGFLSGFRFHPHHTRCCASVSALRRISSPCPRTFLSQASEIHASLRVACVIE